MKITLTNEKQFRKRLEALAPKLRKKIERSAITAAIRPIRQAAKANVPTRTGSLKKWIDTKVKTFRSGVVAGIVGPRRGQKIAARNYWGKTIVISPSKYASLVEAGSKPHVIRRKDGQGNWAWSHPGSPATRFMSKAVSSTASKAQAILVSKIREGVNSL